MQHTLSGFVKGEVQVYWSTRMGKHPEMPTRKASLLKRQKGVCPWCCLHFREGDILEVDHILATALGGKDEFKNLQLLHGHCHNEKTALDMEHIRKHQSTKRLKLINQELNKLVWYWENDILITSNQKVGCSTDKDKYVEYPCAMKVASTVSDGRGVMVTSTSTPSRSQLLEMS